MQRKQCTLYVVHTRDGVCMCVCMSYTRETMYVVCSAHKRCICVFVCHTYIRTYMHMSVCDVHTQSDSGHVVRARDHVCTFTYAMDLSTCSLHRIYYVYAVLSS